MNNENVIETYKIILNKTQEGDSFPLVVTKQAQSHACAKCTEYVGKRKHSEISIEM